MPLFVMIGHDGAEGAVRRNQHRDQHVAYWSDLSDEGRVTLAGPMRTDDDDASCGAVIVFEAADLEQARGVVNGDPYVYGGVFESLTVSPFKHVFPKQS
jgi:uncharacterized protein YciI